MTLTPTAEIYPATTKQVGFIKSLLAERGMDTNVNAEMTKTAASALIKTLLAMPKGVKPTPAAIEAPAAEALATEKQVAFIIALWTERYPEHMHEHLQALKDAAPKLTKTAASKQIKDLLAVPKPVVPKPAPAAPASPTYNAPSVTEYMEVAQKGDVHVLDGEYHRVHLTQYGKKPYAAKAVIYSEAVWDGNKLVKPGRVKWVTAKGRIFDMKETTKATAEEAHAFGKMLGRCCFCSLKIDTPESVTAGYGPICATNKGLPWGATAVVAPDLGNVQAQEGCDQCYCGCKYWENDKCVDCGETFNVAMREGKF